MIILKQGAVLLTTVLVTVGATTASAQLRGRARPVVVKFIGVFQPYDQKAANELQTLTFTHRKDTWLFKVDRLDAMGASPNSGNMLLSRIFPPRLTLSGPSEFIEALKKPETMGKRFALQGWLDTRVRTFRVAEVKEEPSEEAPRGQPEQHAPSQSEPSGHTEPPSDLPFQLEHPNHEK